MLIFFSNWINRWIESSALADGNETNCAQLQATSIATRIDSVAPSVFDGRKFDATDNVRYTRCWIPWQPGQRFRPGIKGERRVSPSGVAGHDEGAEEGVITIAA